MNTKLTVQAVAAFNAGKIEQSGLLFWRAAHLRLPIARCTTMPFIYPTMRCTSPLEAANTRRSGSGVRPSCII